MKFISVSSKEYGQQEKHYASAFDTPAFMEVNSSKCDEVVYGFFFDTKRRLGLAAGIKDGWLRAPFSAPYACFSWVSSEPRVGDFQQAVSSLNDWARARELKGAIFTLPPCIYNEDVVSKAALGFFNAGYRLDKIDLNFAYDLNVHGDNYPDAIDIKGRQKLRASQKEGFSLHYTRDENEFAEAYDIIRANREHRGFPLKMSLQDLRRTAAVLSVEAFVLRWPNGEGAASAICFRTQPQTVQVIYWGNIPRSASSAAMNNLAWRLFDHYKSQGIRLVDTGPSTDEGFPNLGLSDFKQSIGCRASEKQTFSIDFA